MLFDQRVIFSDNGSLTDISLEVNEFREDSYVIPFVSAEDYIYIGSSLPFNHKFIEVDVVNTNAANISISVWDGTVFNPVADIQDATNVSGVSLSRSEVVRFTPDREKTWAMELDSFDVTGLETTKIYQMYWIRIGFDSDLSLTTAIKYIGQKFCSDSDIYDFYPDLNQSTLKASFASGKTDWDEQCYISTQIIVRDLKRRFSILNENQIIDYELFNEPAIHKAAQIIYHGLGQPYYEVRDACEIQYNKAMEQGYLRIDKDKDGLLSMSERQTRQGYLKR